MASDGDILIYQKLDSIEKAQASMVVLLEKIVTQLAAKPPAAPVATYEQLYAPVPPVEDEDAGPDDLPPQPGGWGKAFGRRKV